MQKKTVFVSVPMAGKDDALIKRSIQIAKKKYLDYTGEKAKDIIFMDNHGTENGILHDSNIKSKNVAYLGQAIMKMSLCDAAVFGESWHVSRGCLTEAYACICYGIPFYYINNENKDAYMIHEELENYSYEICDGGICDIIQ